MNEDMWIETWKELPNKNMKVRWKCSDGVEDVGFYYKESNTFVTRDPRSENEITHWQRFKETIPPPPKINT